MKNIPSFFYVFLFLHFILSYILLIWKNYLAAEKSVFVIVTFVSRSKKASLGFGRTAFMCKTGAERLDLNLKKV